MNTKQTMILRYGTSVEVENDLTHDYRESKVLIGADSQRTGFVDITYLRKVHGIGDLKVGDIIINKELGIETLIISKYIEVYMMNMTDTCYKSAQVNNKLSVIRVQTQVDENGDKTEVSSIEFKDIRCYIRVVSNSLRLEHPGLHKETEYVCYIPNYNLNTLDRVHIENIGYLKVVNNNTSDLPGILVLQLCSETRAVV